MLLALFRVLFEAPSFQLWVSAVGGVLGFEFVVQWSRHPGCSMLFRVLFGAHQGLRGVGLRGAWLRGSGAQGRV